MGARDNNLNKGMVCIKYFLIVINALFLLTAMLLILVGRTIEAIFGDFEFFLDDRVLPVPTLLVAVGAIMLVVACFGVIGAFKESTLLTNIYGVLLTLVFVLEVVAAIYAAAQQSHIRGMLERSLNYRLEAYPNDVNSASAVDFMQRSLQCCGVSDLKDWVGILPVPVDADNTTIVVPDSCCAQQSLSSCESYFMEGCLNRMDFIISQSAMIIATGATTVAFVQILGVISAFMLAKTIRRTKSLREAKRYQLQQSLGISSSITEKPCYEDYKRLEKSGISNEKVMYSYAARP